MEQRGAERSVGVVRSADDHGDHGDDRHDHGRWTSAALVGGIAGLVLQWWMLSAGSWNLFGWGRQSDFYDVQARALLDGTLAMDQRVLGIESFARGDQYFMYFGPIPALLRLPIVAFTRHLDGRMAAVSMLLALGVTLLTLLALGWRLRQRVVARSGSHVSTPESIAVGLTFFAMIGGSSLLYASSRTWIYHEAILWGVALTLASLALLLVWLDHGHRRHLVEASVLAMAAILTRPSVGGGALAALGLVAARSLLVSVSGRRRPPDAAGSGPNRWAEGALLSGVVVVPIAVYILVNWLKFRRLLGVPFDQQGYTLLSQQRRDMLEANGGSLFNVEFVPTNLVSYLRPDLVDLGGVFPYVQPTRPAMTIGSPFYDLIDLTSGVTTTMPLLVVLGLVGVWEVMRRRTDSVVRSTWPLLVGCALGTGAVLAIGYLANRYQSDFLPLLVVAALIGLPVLTRWTDSISPRRRGIALMLGSTLVAVGTVSNLALGYSYQRAYSPSIHPETVVAYLDTQARVDGWLGDGVLPRVSQGDALPRNSRLGDIAIVGDCAGLYLSDGRDSPAGEPAEWRLAELAPSSGAAAGTVVLDPAQPAALPLVHVTTAGVSTTVIVDVDTERDVMTVSTITDGIESRGPDLPLRTGTPLAWEAFADPVLGRFEVFLDQRFAAFTDLRRTEPAGSVTVTVGRNVDVLDDIADDATTVVTSSTVSTTVCDGISADLERAGASS